MGALQAGGLDDRVVSVARCAQIWERSQMQVGSAAKLKGALFVQPSFATNDDDPPGATVAE